MRVAKAQLELAKLYDDGNESEYAALKEHLKEKYEIPIGVYLWGSPYEALCPEMIKEIKPHLSAFIKGALTDETFSDMYFWFEEFGECDYGWILLEQPMGHYDAGDGMDLPAMEDIISEMRSIGTRNQKKARNLRKIAGAFSA